MFCILCTNLFTTQYPNHTTHSRISAYDQINLILLAGRKQRDRQRRQNPLPSSFFCIPLHNNDILQIWILSLILPDIFLPQGQFMIERTRLIIRLFRAFNR